MKRQISPGLVTLALMIMASFAHAEVGVFRGWLAASGGSAGYASEVLGAPSLTATRYGLTLGTDTEFEGGWLAGVSGSAGRQVFRNGPNNGDSNDLLLGLYGRKSLFEAGYVAASFQFGWHDIAVMRGLQVAVARSQVQSLEWGGRAEAGWRWWLDPQDSLAPFAAFGAQTYHTPAFSEAIVEGGPPQLAVSYAPHDSNIAHLELGARGGRNIEMEDARLWVELTAGWSHEMDNTPFAQTPFPTLAGTVINVILPAKETAIGGINLQVQPKTGLAYGIRFDGQAGGNVTLWSGNANVAWRW